MKNKEKWQDVLRLLHKFCPQSKKYIRERRDFSLDNISSFINHLETQRSDLSFDAGLDCIEIFNAYYGDFLEFERDRVLVIPDANWDEKFPFVCSVQKLVERIDEGIILESDKKKDTAVPWKLIDEGSDSLFVFETTGSVLFFDHHQHCVLARPH